MPEKILNNEFIAFMSKIIIPAFITVAIATAIDVKNDVSKVSWITVFMSFIIGVGGAYLAGDLIMEKYQGGEIPVAVAIVTSLTEKTFKYLLHKLKVDQFIAAIFDAIFGAISGNKNNKK